MLAYLRDNDGNDKLGPIFLSKQDDKDLDNCPPLKRPCVRIAMAPIGHGGRNSSSKPRNSSLSMEQKKKA